MRAKQGLQCMKSEELVSGKFSQALDGKIVNGGVHSRHGLVQTFFPAVLCDCVPSKRTDIMCTPTSLFFSFLMAIAHDRIYQNPSVYGAYTPPNPKTVHSLHVCQ